MRVDDYLDRLQYAGPTSATAETLVQLHRRHMMSVPFENLDIHLGVPIVLSVPAFYEKIVTRRRGGFCYELNGLFAWLLEELGFKVALHSARLTYQGRVSPEFDHLVLTVELPDLWVADVGFGESSLDPLRVGPEATGPADGYDVVDDQGVWTMRQRSKGTVEPRFIFTTLPRRLEEFEAQCLFQQTSPRSHFTHGTICTRPTPSGRMTIAGRELIVTSGEHRDERELRDGAELRGVLAREFGIALTDDEAGRLAATWRPATPA